MRLIGLSGKARAGKDTVADRLVAEHGFLKFGFSDALYREVAEAFGVKESFLRDPATKEGPTDYLRLVGCSDFDFRDVALTVALTDLVRKDPHGTFTNAYWLIRSGLAHDAIEVANQVYGRQEMYAPRSPRWILQLWGTEYRRAQNPDYWVEMADAWLQRATEFGYVRLVNTAVRFENEAEWIRANGGHVWRVERPRAAKVNEHMSERPVALLPGEPTLANNGSIDELHALVDELAPK